MSNRPCPPPPPPPPPPLAPTNSLESPAKLQRHLSPSVSDKSFEEQLEEACKGHGSDEALLVLGWRHARGLLQDGPQCGLVALQMGLEALDENDTNVDIDKLLEVAKARGFTRQGEMFDVENLKELANAQVHGLEATVEPTALLLKAETVVEKLKNSVFLIPYDIGKDQRPFLAKGHQAHWCLAIGIVFRLSNEENKSEPSHDSLVNETMSLKHGNIRFLPNRSSSKLCDSSKIKPVGLLVRQSKSKRLFVYDVNTLVNSNENLEEIDGSKRNEQDFFIPKGGISKGLKDKMIVLSSSRIQDD